MALPSRLQRRLRRRRQRVLLAGGLALLIGGGMLLARKGRFAGFNMRRLPSLQSRWKVARTYHPITVTDPVATRIVEGAKQQQGTAYNADYEVISYPNGDVPATRGACTDVVVRALRHAGYDLQRLIHEDKAAHLSLYPVIGTTTTADKNIDHRRVPNQMRYLKRFGIELPNEVSARTLSTWKPGDIVYWKLGTKQHTGIISNWANEHGVPLVVHNMGICVEQDCLTAWPIIGHYRFPKSGAHKPAARTHMALGA